MKVNVQLFRNITFATACMVVIAAFITATTYLQLVVAMLLYLVLAIFAWNILTGIVARVGIKVSTISPHISQTNVGVSGLIGPSETREINISDIDKRVFLKLIGGAGIFLFLFSLLSKQSENLFFKNFPKQSLFGTAGNISESNNNNVQSQPLDGYIITEIDNEIISFYGFTNKEGLWYIMKVDTELGSVRYIKGTLDFA